MPYVDCLTYIDHEPCSRYVLACGMAQLYRLFTVNVTPRAVGGRAQLQRSSHINVTPVWMGWHSYINCFVLM